MAPIWKRTLFTVGLGLFALGATEAVLSIAAIASPTLARLLESPWVPATIPDARLRYRPNPAHPEHDARGFRNPAALERAEIVALGDSQTYGTGVPPADAWPRQLERETGRSVYAMAFGGYGPAHALLLQPEALALEPDVLIVTLYTGNDLFDSFDLVHGHRQLAELASDDPERRARIEALEAKEPLGQRVMRLLEGGQPVATAASDAPERSLASPIRDRSRLYGLVRRLKLELSRRLAADSASPDADWEAAQALARRLPESYEAFEDEDARTVFMCAYRAAALDLADERIAEGLDIALRAIDRMSAEARAHGIRFVVVVIPTKEAVFSGRWTTPSEGFARLGLAEADVVARIRTHLASQGIESVEVLDALRARLARGEQPYPPSQDGHPNAAGHRAIAEAVAAALAR